MIGEVLRGARQRRGLRPWLALCTGWVLCAATGASAQVDRQGVRVLNDGVRWIGKARTCKAPTGWLPERLFASPGLPADLAGLCLYTWKAARPAPNAAELTDLASVSGAQELTEDIPALFPSAAFSPAEVAVLSGLRGALRAQVGDASLLPSFPARPVARIVVIDSAPDAAAGHIQAGASRHGDTLAHLIEDLVCLPVSRGARGGCAAEVTTALALPLLTASGQLGPSGGYMGTLADLARAIDRTMLQWKADQASGTAPARLILNLSLGWEDTPGVADCPADLTAPLTPPARAVRGILQYAAGQGALIIAAAGNDTGGPWPRQGLVCPGRYQAVAQDADKTRALGVAVSGVDYEDRPLATVRPLGVTGIVGLGLGGVAWSPSDPVPPPLTGSSVSTAVVSAVSALAWAQQPSWPAAAVTSAVYQGGVDLGVATDHCPLLLTSCSSHRASVCGALLAAGALLICAPPAPRAWSCPALPGETAGFAAAFTSLPPTVGASALASPATSPRSRLPTPQILPWTYPMPIADSCPTCMVEARALSIPARDVSLREPVLVVQFTDGSGATLALGPPSNPPGPLTSSPPVLSDSTAYVFTLPDDWGAIRSAYISALDLQGQYSITEQIVVQP